MNNANNLRPTPYNDNPMSGWANRVAGSSNSNRLVAGRGINIEYDANGTIISRDDGTGEDRMQWAGDWNISSSYYPGDVVRVRYDQVYYNEFGESIPVGDTTQTIDQDLGDIIPISLGLFICVHQVGPIWQYEEYVNSTFVPQYAIGSLPDSYVESTRFLNYNVYYPIFPEIPTSYTSSIAVFDGNYTTTANDVFWVALPIGATVAKLCENGVEKTFYVLGVASGSKFDPSNLPYTA